MSLPYENNFTVDLVETKIGTTGPHAKGVALMIGGTGLGGGTFELRTKPAGSALDAQALNAGTALALGDQKAFEIGGDMEIYVYLNGATGPDFDVFISETSKD
tara:strand:+ start:2685 stop:2993 length:309 start_codon:yes stop_codon:yes gene_type:complete